MRFYLRGKVMKRRIKMEKYKELFKEFMEKEYLRFIEISTVGFGTIKIELSESGCCDHAQIIYIYVDDEIKFENFSCDVKNLNSLFNAINKLVKNYWGMIEGE
jgi:hypothetical protein